MPETGVLANHSSDFNLAKRPASRPYKQPCLWRPHHNLKIGQETGKKYIFYKKEEYKWKGRISKCGAEWMLAVRCGPA